MISGLPSEIKLLIVSFVPLKEAVRTSILSTKWRSLWAPLQVILQLDSAQVTSHEASEKIKEAMGVLLRSHDTPQPLKLHISSSKMDIESSEVMDEVFIMVVKRVDKELHLDFSKGKQTMRDFNLVLDSSCLNSGENIHSMQRTDFSSLKSLHLRSIAHLAENFVSTLFSSCRFLESLTLEKCSGLQDIRIKASDCLRSFVMVDCTNVISISLSASNLKSFWYRGVLSNFQLKNTPHLVDMILNLKDGSGQNEFDVEDALSFLDCVKDIEILTISGWLLEWLCTAGVIFGLLEFQFNKLKELCCICTVMDRGMRDSLACFLNATPFLEKLFVNIDENCSSPMPCPYFQQYWHEPHLCMNYATVKCNASQLKHLSTFKMAGFTSEEDQLLLMDLLLHKALLLETVTVTSPENRSWSVAKIPQCHLNRFQRFQPESMVASLPNKDYSFVLTEEKNSDKSPKSGYSLLF
ncbi:unnamed protein product [Ilex paraguariensis]|uniref:F-box domain-containing protein n=1 Tax=Ilex paraguariensis TaxID=185542 RepID=A0ABC8RA51_9AQUA